MMPLMIVTLAFVVFLFWARLGAEGEEKPF